MPLWLLDLPSLKLAHCYVHRLKDADTWNLELATVYCTMVW